ncbi:putative capsular polysaccharide synthesis family protein [Flocculibacter collagenilyticus]|uniref:putative capsular polysaccharide synthesis family protein n=1 Tax=Flocculibacter collagenilyticus TaxID=2744479 RepID=UPI0018F3C950|nr:putative capsular polysaccharide synthesis family protein [Flocculibacter collagenilyticus]
MKSFNFYVRYKKLFQRYLNKDSVFIYQMGKVGSTSLEGSIDGAVHVHTFHARNHTCPVRLRGMARFGGRYYLNRLKQELVYIVCKCLFKRRRQTKIISLVREPLSRNISMFFHDIDAYIFSAYTNCLGGGRQLSTREQSSNFLVEVFSSEFNHEYPVKWFDEELKATTGIDIYDYSFDINKGYALIQSGKFSLLLLRSDKLTQNIAIIESFVGREIKLGAKNLARDKWYWEAYQQFIDNYKLSESMSKLLYDNRFMKHFFSKDEISALKVEGKCEVP